LTFGRSASFVIRLAIRVEDAGQISEGPPQVVVGGGGSEGEFLVVVRNVFV
jgi:hypothetical protein